jgi:hypothetical protein
MGTRNGVKLPYHKQMQYPFLNKIWAQMKENLHSVYKGVCFETESIARASAFKQFREFGDFRAIDVLPGALLEGLKDLWRNAVM